MIIDEALYNIKQGYGIPHKHDTLTTIIEYVKQTEPCEDAIRRQAVLNTLDDMDKALDIDRTVENYKALLKECFEDLTPVQPKAKSEWIPIKTRPLTEKEKAEMGTESNYMYDCPLPDDGEEVEVTTYLGDVAMDIFCRDPDGCYFEHYCDDGDVVAWRHKPDPYKAESEEAKC